MPHISIQTLYFGWVCIAKKEEFKPGDLAVYIEIDSKCPESDERFAYSSNTIILNTGLKCGFFVITPSSWSFTNSAFINYVDKDYPPTGHINKDYVQVD